MKLSILSIVGITLASSNVLVYGNEACLNNISEAQTCIRTCGMDNSPEGATFSNLLTECISKEENFLQMDSCCQMTDDCKTFWSASSTCLTDTLTTIKTASIDYLQCLNTQVCQSTEYCVNLLTGGAGQGYPNDFALGSDTLETMSSGATTCTDMDPFLTNACTTINGCCSTCAPRIAAVVEAVTNALLLPVYNRGSLSTCTNMTCPKASKRELMEEESTTATTTATTTTDGTSLTPATGDGFDNMVNLATDCNDGLAQDIVVYNETHAVDNFFGCLTQKMGTIMSEADTMKMTGQEVEGDNNSSSSSSSFFFGMGASLAVSVVASFIAH